MHDGNALLRAGQGLVLIVAPDDLVRGLVRGPVTPAANAAVRVLGIRQLVQALVYARTPTRAILMIGTVTDLAHCVSMLTLAVVDRRWRHAALADSLGAAAHAYVGLRRLRSGGGASRALLPLPPQ